MKFLNIILILLILFLLYKITKTNENFQPITDLEDKTVILNKNVFVNIDKLDDYNNIKELDLNKNNLIVNNNSDKKFEINTKLCIGDYCLDSINLKEIGGDNKSPKFYKNRKNPKKGKKEIYYNHDSLRDIPNELCFDSYNNDKDDTCINYKHLEMLKGERGIKLNMNNKLNNEEDEYITPYYIDFRDSGIGMEASKDQLFFKKETDKTHSKLFYKEQTKGTSKHRSIFNNRKYPLYSHIENELGCDELPKSKCLKEGKTEYILENLSNEGRLCPVKCGVLDEIKRKTEYKDWKWVKKNKKIDDEHLSYEYDIPTSHGWYIHPGEVDPNYDGYYISDKNYNSRYKLRSNAIATAFKHGGNYMDNHRASHNGKSENKLSDSKEIANRVYFCNHGRNRLLHKGYCLPVLSKKEDMAESYECSDKNEVIPK